MGWFALSMRAELRQLSSQGGLHRCFLCNPHALFCRVLMTKSGRSYYNETSLQVSLDNPIVTK